MKAVLPVAGSGTRMYPLGVTTPKCLLSVVNKPLLIWSLEALRHNQVDTVIVVVSGGEFGQLIREFVDKQLVAFPQLKGLNVKIAIQEEQLGTAHVLQVTKEYFSDDEEFLFMYGDDLYGPGNIQAVQKSPGLAIIAQKVDDPEKWGILQTDAQNQLVNVVEKPTNYVGNLASTGCMKLHSRIFKLFDQITPTSRGEYELTDSLQLLIQEFPITVITSPDYWIPIGYPWHLLTASEYFLPKLASSIIGTVEEDVVIHGNVVLPKSSTIKAGTKIEGNVLIGENVTIGPNAYLRDNVVIGDNSQIGFSVEVKNSVIGRHCRANHLSYIGDSILGNYCSFSAGCVASNFRHDGATIQTPVKGVMIDTKRRKFGTVLGDHVKLGVNTVIYPGRKIWPGLVTLPGQIVDKDLTA